MMRQLLLSAPLAHAARIHDSADLLAGCRAPLRELTTAAGSPGCYFKCDSDLKLPVVAAEKKGLALDDTTLHWCPGNAPFHWPNTNEPVTSFRMFKAWASDWNEPTTSKKRAWEQLNTYLKATNGKVLVGTSISCSEAEDDADWENVKAMLRIFGPERIMGLAIGNELELLWTKTEVIENLDECLDRLWKQDYFLDKFHDRVKEFDAMGFQDVKVTSVFGGFILAEPGSPFYDRTDKNIARVNPFLQNVTKTFGDRYAHTVNIYPFFEDHFIEFDNPNANHDWEPPRCEGALAKAMCFNAPDPNKCLFTWMVTRVRERMDWLGNKDATLWIGETGWSYPKAHTLDTKMKWCAEWSTTESFASYYANFLDWDVNMQGKYKGPDHVFYFSMRDSQNFGLTENFGLVGDGDPTMWCKNTTCKLQRSSWSLSPPDTEAEEALREKKAKCGMCQGCALPAGQCYTNAAVTTEICERYNGEWCKDLE